MAALVEQVQTTELRSAAAGRSPWALAWRRLRRNRIALAALGLFLLIVVVCLAAPLYAHHVAHDGNVLSPNLNGTTIVHGKVVPVMQEGGGLLKLGETPIGPDLGYQSLLPRRRRSRPGRGGAGAVRRPRLAADRDLLSGAVLHRGDRGRAHRGLLRRA